jgi:thioredoxin reductase (NADPH)
VHYPIIVIGGGPIGLACGIEAKNAGIEYLIIEKGCLVNSLFHYPENMTFFSTSERLEIGGIPFVSKNARPSKPEALEYYRRVAQAEKINIHLFEKVKEIKRQNSKDNKQNGGEKHPDTNFIVTTDKDQYTASSVIIATGFYDIPYLLNVPGEDLPKVTHYFKDPHFYAFQKVIVVGASNSAVDAALETWRKGAEVTMMVRGNSIGERVKYWVKPDIENRISEGSIKAYFNSAIEEIREKEVLIKTPEGTISLENDWVIAMTGYQPDLDFLRNTGVHLSADGVMKPEVDETTYQTNIPDLYLAGVICGGLNTHRLFIENSREHAEKIIEAFCEKTNR